MDLKSLAYQGHPVSFSVSLAGIDISSYVSGVIDISKSLDYPRLTEYRIGESTISLNDSEGFFSPRNVSNFFVERGHLQSGADVACEIEAGFIVDGVKHTELIFTGKVVKVSQNAQRSETILLISDAFNTLFRDEVLDVGISRHFHLDVGESDDIHGFYPIADFLGAASKGSTEVFSGLNMPLTEVESLSSVGKFDSSRYRLTEGGIKTEGGSVSASKGYPQIRMKSPYRHRLISDVIIDILRSLDISDAEVAIPRVLLELDFYSQGRLGYEFISTSGFIGSSAEGKWTGYVTDFLWEVDRYYVLLNASRDSTNRSTLFWFNPLDYTYEILYRSAEPTLTFRGTEFWKLAKLGNTVAILCSDSDTVAADNLFPDYRGLNPSPGSYDAREPNNQVYIVYYNVVSETSFVAVAKDDQYRAQLAHYYVLGGTYYDTLPATINASRDIVTEVLPDMLPDTRRSMLWYENELYYAYVDGNSLNKFGVAKCNLAGDMTESVVALTTDGTNHAGLSFFIDGNTLYVGYTRRRGGGSSILLFSKAL